MAFNGKTIKFLGGFLGMVRHPIRSAQYGLHTLNNFFEKTSWRIQYENKYKNGNMVDGIIDDNESAIDEDYTMSANDAVNSLLSRSKYKLSQNEGKRLEGALNTMYKNCSEEELVKILLNSKNIDTKEDLEGLIYNTLCKISDIIKEDDKKLNIEDINNFEYLDIYDALALVLGSYKTNEVQDESVINLITYIDVNNESEMKKIILSNGFVKNEEDFNNLIIILQKELVDSSSDSILTEEEKQNIDNKFSNNKKQDEDEYSGIDFKRDDILDILSIYFSSEKLSDMQRNTIISKIQNLSSRFAESVVRDELEKLTKQSVSSKYDALFRTLNEIESNLKDIENVAKVGYRTEITKKYSRIMNTYSDRIYSFQPKGYYFEKFEELCKTKDMEDAVKEVLESLDEFEKQCANSYTKEEANEIENIKREIKEKYINLFDEDKEDICSKITEKFKDLAPDVRFIKTKEALESYLLKLNDLLKEDEKDKNKHQEELLEYENKIVEKYNELIDKYADLDVDIASEEKYLATFEKFCESMDAKMAYDAIIDEFSKLYNMCANATEIQNIYDKIQDTLSVIIAKDENYANDIERKLETIVNDNEGIELSLAHEKNVEDLKTRLIDLQDEVDNYMKINQDKFNYIDLNFELNDQIIEKVHYLRDKGLVSNYCDAVMKKIEETLGKYDNISNLNLQSLIDDTGELRHIKYEIEEYIKSLENPEADESNKEKTDKDFHVLTPTELVDLYKKDDSEEEKVEEIKVDSEKAINIESLYDKRNEYARKVIYLSDMIELESEINDKLSKDIKLTSLSLEEGLNYCKDEDLIDRFNFTTIRLRQLAEEKSLYESKLKQAEILIGKKEHEKEEQDKIKQIELENEIEEENKQREIEYEKAYLEAERIRHEEIEAKKEEIRKEIANIKKRKTQKAELERIKERRARQLAKKEEKAARLAKKEEANRVVPSFESYITDYVQSRTNDLVKEAIMTYNDQFGEKHM